jgi:uncharacterized protein (TIGR03437 family)
MLYGAFASDGQVNLMIPGATADGMASVSLTLPGGGVIGTVVSVADTAPAIFTANASGQGLFAGQVLYVHSDGGQTFAGSTTPIALKTAGDQVYLVLYGTGLRHAAALTATLNGANVPVVYFGAQETYPGLDQVNVGPLATSLAGSGNVTLVISAGGQSANPVTVSIQ